MLFQDLSPHVHFLSDAAHLLSQSAPETSAFLMRRRNDLLVENDIPIPDAQRQHVCSCCGHIMVPGQGVDALKIETDKVMRPRTRTRPRPRSQPQPRRPPPPPTRAQEPMRAMPGGTSKVATCGNCSRQTRLPLEGPARIPRPKKANRQKTTAGQGSTPSLEPAKVSANASSKKRAKSRKAGLQALLEQTKGAASSAGSGFSLSDFMKK